MKTNDHAIVRHLEDDDLISYLDGELLRAEQAQARAHLESCWSCRTRLATRQTSVENFVRLRQDVLLPRELPPEGPKLNLFRQRLDAHIEANRRRPRLGVDLVRLRSSLRSFVRRFEGDRFMFLASPVTIRAAVALVVVAILAVIVLRSNRVTTVSANELIQRAVDSQAANLRATSQAVIHQRLQLRRRLQANEETATWETWNDTANARFVQECSGCASESNAQSSVAVPDSQHSTPNTLIADLNAVLAANRMDPQRPLSASSYQSWHSTLQHQQDEVKQAKLADGSEALTLRTVPENPRSAGLITEAVFAVRASDWQPAELRLTVKTDNGDRIYELTATLSEVVSLTQIDPKIFAAPSTASSNQPAITKLETRNSQPELALSPLAPSPIAASAELEVESLRLLHQAGADMGEQITVKRVQGGPVRVTGIVESDQRKAEILSALSSLANNPAVQIDVQTVAEAIAKQKQKPTTRSSETAEGVEIENTGIAAEPQLRAYFEGRGVNVDQAVRQFASKMVSQSHQAMQHLGAMRRLANQFSTDQLRTLTPEARENWLSLVRAHARAYQQLSSALRRDLKPVFFASVGEDLPNTAVVLNDEALKQAVQELFAVGAANDQIIRSAFTMTNSGTRFTAIGAPQFWQQMKKAEALTTRIQAAH